MDRTEQIATFKRIAKRNYDKSYGWSVFTECYDDDDIREFFEFEDSIGLDRLNSEEGIEKVMSGSVDVWDDRYADAKNNAAF